MGYEGWMNSLRFNMGNYRTTLCRAGIKDVAVNTEKCRKINPEGAASRTNIKRPRRGEVNFLPNNQGETKDALESLRLEMVEQFRKAPSERDMVHIYLHMQRTIALRREEIVNLRPPVEQLKERWPALFCEAQLYTEFYRITNQNLQYCFFSSLDKYTPQLLKLYRKRRTGSLGEVMEKLMKTYDEQDKNDITAARTAALVGLVLHLKEDSSEVFKPCKEEMEAAEGAVALLALVNEEDIPARVPFEIRHVSIVLEDQVLMSHRSWSDSLVILFGLINAAYLSYPKKLSSFFEFIQVVLLHLVDGRKQLQPKLQALRNELE